MILLEPTITPSHNEKSCKLQLSNGMHCNLCHGQIKDNIKRYSHLLLTTDPIQKLLVTGVLSAWTVIEKCVQYLFIYLNLIIYCLESDIFQRKHPTDLN